MALVIILLMTQMWLLTATLECRPAAPAANSSGHCSGTGREIARSGALEYRIE